MAPTVPTICPTELVAGDTHVWTRVYPDFPVGDGWTFAYTLSGPSKGTASVSTASGLATFTLSSAVTAVLLPGTYRFLVTATLSGARYAAESGIITVTPDIVNAAAGTLLHQDDRELALLNTAIEARATSDHTGYTIDGRSLDREPLPELLAWRDKLRARIARRRRGRKVGTIGVHFTRGVQ